MYKQFYISLKIILNKRFLVFKTHCLYCHELIFYKWVNLQKPRHQYEQLSSILQLRNQEFFGTEKISWRRDASINTSCVTYKKRALQGETFAFFPQGTLKNCISIENLTHRCKQTGQFFTKLGYFLSILKDNRGDTLPYTSWAPKLIYFLKRR